MTEGWREEERRVGGKVEEGTLKEKGGGRDYGRKGAGGR